MHCLLGDNAKAEVGECNENEGNSVNRNGDEDRTERVSSQFLSAPWERELEGHVIRLPPHPPP